MTEERKKALTNLKTVKGQIEGIIKMIDDNRYCIDISNQIQASIAILKKANYEILQGHLNNCIKNDLKDNSQEKVDEILSIIKRMS